MPDIDTPTSVRKLDSASAVKLIKTIGAFEDMQAVLSCCERLVPRLADTRGGERDTVTIEALWTLALLSYARAFSDAGGLPSLTEDDIVATQQDPDVLRLHKMLLLLREQHAHPTENPRETYTVGLAQDADGAVNAVAVTSVSAPPVDEAAVRQAGALAFPLCELLEQRINEQQKAILNEAHALPRATIEAMETIDVVAPS